MNVFVAIFLIVWYLIIVISAEIIDCHFSRKITVIFVTLAVTLTAIVFSFIYTFILI